MVYGFHDSHPGSFALSCFLKQRARVGRAPSLINRTAVHATDAQFDQLSRVLAIHSAAGLANKNTKQRDVLYAGQMRHSQDAHSDLSGSYLQNLSNPALTAFLLLFFKGLVSISAHHEFRMDLKASMTLFRKLSEIQIQLDVLYSICLIILAYSCAFTACLLLFLQLGNCIPKPRATRALPARQGLGRRWPYLGRLLHTSYLAPGHGCTTEPVFCLGRAMAPVIGLVWP